MTSLGAASDESPEGALEDLTPAHPDPDAPNLSTGELELTDQITIASNETFLGTIDGTVVVYKPIEGEAPLWDFPGAVLANREVAAFVVSEAFGWSVVPRTWLRDGPFGMGMVQLWQDIDPDQDAVDVVSAEKMPDEGWLHVFDGRDGTGRGVALIHEDSTALRRMAIFDVVTNNADRKGGHILPMADGHRYGVDHGLTFHVEHKLRTVLWGWLGDELSDQELANLDRVRCSVSGELGEQLRPLLDEYEIAAFAKRCERLMRAGRFPAPQGSMPAVPWPLF